MPRGGGEEPRVFVVGEIKPETKRTYVWIHLHHPKVAGLAVMLGIHEIARQEATNLLKGRLSEEEFERVDLLRGYYNSGRNEVHLEAHDRIPYRGIDKRNRILRGIARGFEKLLDEETLQKAVLRYGPEKKWPLSRFLD